MCDGLQVGSKPTNSGREDTSGDCPQIVLNDQGGAQMSITYDVCGCLRAFMKGHPPIVLERL